MNRTAKIAALRSEAACRERVDGHDWAAAATGEPALDTVLPQGGLALGVLHECFAQSPADFPATLGFGLSALSRIMQERPGHVLWALNAYQHDSEGMLYPEGLAAFGIDPSRLIHVSVPKTPNILWALEEALSTVAVSAVIGILPPGDKAYDFTASRRLALHAAKYGVTAVLMASRPAGIATAAEMRWAVSSAPSTPRHRAGYYVPGVGTPRWQVNLVKSRKGTTGRWTLEWNHEALCFRVAAPLADRKTVRVSRIVAGQRALAG